MLQGLYSCSLFEDFFILSPKSLRSPSSNTRPFFFPYRSNNLTIFHGFDWSEENGPKQEMGRVVLLLRLWLICDMPASFLVSALLESWSSGLFCQTLPWKTVSQGYRCPVRLRSKFLTVVV